VTDQPNLRESAKSSVIWSAGVTLASDVLQFLTMLVMVRLLSPAIYGQQALAQTIIALLGVATLKTLGPFALQARDPSDFDWQAHFSAGAILNGAVFAITCVIGFALSVLGESTEVIGTVVLVLAPVFVLDLFASFRLCWLQAHHQWKRMRLLLVAGALVATMGGVAGAALGMGVYSLAIMPCLGCVPLALDFFFGSKRPEYSTAALARYGSGFGFGVKRAIGSTAYAARSLAESTTMSALVGYAAVGAFTRAIGLGQMTCGRIGPVAVQTLFSVLTRAEASTERFRRSSSLLLQGVTWLSVPAAAFIAIESGAVVRLLYGERWLAVTPLLPLACILVTINGASTTIYHAMLANLQTSQCLRIDALSFVAGMTAIAFMPLGVSNYLAALLILQPIVLLATTYLASRGGAVSVRGLIDATAPCLFAAIIAALACSTIQSNPSASLTELLLHFVASGLLFGAVYLAVLCIGAPKATVAILDFLPVPNSVRYVIRPVLDHLVVLRK
jgi:O-antigen/teichoic acid export membrane protein